MTLQRPVFRNFVVIQYDPQKKCLSLGVGDLIRHGTQPVIRMSPAVRARLRAGAEEHRFWQADAQSSSVYGEFRAEAQVARDFELDGVHISLHGRVDALHRRDKTLLIEEIKTVLVPSENFGEPLAQSVRRGESYEDYRFQVEIYAWMLSTQAQPGADLTTPAEKVHARLVFRNLSEPDEDSRELTVEVDFDLEAVQQRVHERIRAVLEDCGQRELRRESLAGFANQLPFPFPEYRRHQRDVETASSEALDSGQCLLLAAPPGIGKTAAVLHAALLFALPRGYQVFWCTAKTTQQRIVVETVERILERWRETSGTSEKPPLRAAVLRAREKMCPNRAEGGLVFCHDSYCRFAADFGRKLTHGHLREELLELPIVTPEACYEHGVRAEACPYELSLDVALEADLIVGDYNYVFDRQSALRRFRLDAIFKRSILVVDEAHNLYRRGREYHSPALHRRTLADFRDWTMFRPGLDPGPQLTVADKLANFFEDSAETIPVNAEASTFIVEVDRAQLREIAGDLEALRANALLEGGALTPDDPLELLAREIQRFVATLDLADDDVPLVTFVDRRDHDETLRVLCLDPAKPLGAKIQSFAAAIGMSATLEPLDFFRDVLGFPLERTLTATFPTPFPSTNRLVRIDPSFATTYRRRSRDTKRIVDLVEAVRSARRGNYLVFLSSYQYLREVVAHVPTDHVGDDVIVQEPGMSEGERNRVLDLLREPGSHRVLFGVQGGIFSEGVDYPGAMAIGVIVVGPGLPRFTFEEDLVRSHFDELYQKGYEYAYLNPGMQRVLQSAGRVIRTPDDVGIVLLLGERFGEPRYCSAFPSEWYDTRPGELISQDIVADVQTFWEKHCPGESRNGKT